MASIPARAARLRGVLVEAVNGSPPSTFTRPSRRRFTPRQPVVRQSVCACVPAYLPSMRQLALWFTAPICLLALNSTTSEEYCITCKAMMADCEQLFDDDFSSVTEEELTATTSSLCGKYYMGFEEVICSILCEVNAHDLLNALRDDVSIGTICEKGGVCRPRGNLAS
ncbi:hypothetical protein Y032_0096g2933 [Ancylostoma ceylanicum]|uniref:Saposin B-type domain-containing protein n=1 Tax=Ancylostoma ceylanicum TaxID=53326 RepID=A0A016TKC9_9BILA|nr:hypothetical protein Y032_0096g2933 [Ancylostoma ceylanicum]